MPSRLSAPKVRAQMLAQGITPTQLSSASGLSPSTIDRIINDRATNYSDYTVHRVAQALNCSPFDILTEQAINSTITESAATAVAEVVAEAVAEAVSVVVDEVAPDVQPEAVAEAVPNMSVSAPPVLDVAAYVSYIQQAHRDEIANMTAVHEKHLQDIAHEKNAWKSVALVLGGVLSCITIWLITHL